MQKTIRFTVLALLFLASSSYVLADQKSEDMTMASMPAMSMSSMSATSSASAINRINQFNWQVLNFGSSQNTLGSKAPVGTVPAEQLQSAVKARKQIVLKLMKEDPMAFFAAKISPAARAALPEAIQSDVEKAVTLEGTIEVLSIDDFVHHVTRHLYYLHVGAERLEFFPAGGMLYLRSGAKVKITGYQLDNVVVATTDTAHFQITVPATAIESIGDQKTLVILIDYLDSGQNPFTPAEARNMIFNGQFQKFYKEQSYNKVSFSGDVLGWFMVPRNLGIENCYEGGIPPEANLSNPDLLQYISQNNLNLHNYRRVVYLVNHPNFPGGCSGVGTFNYFIGSDFYKLSQSWIGSIPFYNVQGPQPFPWTNFDNILSHEIGHALGVMHANGWDCGNQSLYGDCQHIEYGNYFDTMGTGGFSLQFNAFYKELLGWITPQEEDLIFTSGDYSLNSLEASTSAKKLAKIQMQGTDKKPFYLEYRNAIGFDSNLGSPEYSSNLNGLFINKITDQTYGYSFPRLIDASPTSLGWYNDSQQATLNGSSTLVDTNRGITIGPILNSGPTATLTVNGSHIAYLREGDFYNYSWSSTDGTIFGSSNSSSCGGMTTPWGADTQSGHSSGIVTASQSGCTYTVTYNVSGQNGSAQDRVVVIVERSIPLPPTVPKPTATLTVNGSHYVTVNAGDTVTYVWNSTNSDLVGTGIRSSYTNSCTPNAIGDWGVNTISGTSSGVIAPSQAGCTYTIVYNVAGLNASAQDRIVVKVNPLVIRNDIDFRVRITPPVCERPDPGVAQSFYSSQVQIGGSGSANVTFNNRDSDGCGASDFSVSASVPSGWQSDVYPGTAVSVLPGENGYASAYFSVPYDAIPGPYQVSITIHNNASGKQSTQVFPIDVVPAPVIDSVSPSTGLPGTLVTLTGSGLSKLIFGSIGISGANTYTNINRSFEDDNTVTFAFPTSMNLNNCPDPGGICPYPTPSGWYGISLFNNNLSSNVVYFEVASPVPHISFLDPSTGQIGTHLSIHGSNFTPNGNDVQFGAVKTTGLSSVNGVISFTVPSQYLSPCPAVGRGCLNSIEALGAGQYLLSVHNINGTSTPAIFTVTAPLPDKVDSTINAERSLTPSSTKDDSSKKGTESKGGSSDASVQSAQVSNVISALKSLFSQVNVTSNLSAVTGSIDFLLGNLKKVTGQ